MSYYNKYIKYKNKYLELRSNSNYLNLLSEGDFLEKSTTLNKNKFLNLRKQNKEFNIINEDRKIEDFVNPINKNKYLELCTNFNTISDKALNVSSILQNDKQNQNGGMSHIPHKRNNKTYIDFITKYSNETIKIDLSNEIDINKILNKHFKNIIKLICLDFHGVTDLYNDNEKIPSNLPKCVISYIGGNPETIRNTINTIKPRILSEELILGIIVYNKNDNPTCGTKGWIISKIMEVNENMNIHFIDDSKKNIQCVENIKSANIKTYYINKYKNPKQYTTKVLSRI